MSNAACGICKQEKESSIEQPADLAQRIEEANHVVTQKGPIREIVKLVRKINNAVPLKPIRKSKSCESLT